MSMRCSSNTSKKYLDSNPQTPSSQILTSENCSPGLIKNHPCDCCEPPCQYLFIFVFPLSSPSRQTRDDETPRDPFPYYGGGTAAGLRLAGPERETRSPQSPHLMSKSESQRSFQHLHTQAAAPRSGALWYSITSPGR